MDEKNIGFSTKLHDDLTTARERKSVFYNIKLSMVYFFFRKNEQQYMEILIFGPK